MKKFRLVFIFLLLISLISAQEKDENVVKVISMFQKKDIHKIADNIRYPLKREYPIPAINNKKEMISRFFEVFDETLKSKIENSKPADWSEVGWRGTMLENGVVWLDYESSVITAVNYQSKFEKELLKKLIDEDRKQLHQSLKNYSKPTYKIITETYLIRIDELKPDLYRYASWKRNSKENAKPDLVLTNGTLEFQGSGGNHVIEFHNANFTYKIFRNIVSSEDSGDFTLLVEKFGKTVLVQEGMLHQ